MPRGLKGKTLIRRYLPICLLLLLLLVPLSCGEEGVGIDVGYDDTLNEGADSESQDIRENSI